MVPLPLLWLEAKGRVARAKIARMTKHANLVESLSGLETIKSLRAESTVQGRWENQVEALASLRLRSKKLSTAITNLSQVIYQFAYVSLVVAGVYQISKGNMTMGGLIACSILTGRVMAPMAQVSSLLTRLHQSLTAYTSLDNIMDYPVEQDPQQPFLHRPGLKGVIEFKDVKFTYPGQSHAILEGVSFKINAGERVALVGRVGSGKSTIQKLIQGFYPVSEGSILIDGTDIRQIDPADLRKQVGAVPQDVILFSGSVKENIIFGLRNCNEDEIARATGIVGLSDYLQRHPQGFDMQVGERGMNLSGGQRQCVAIARSILREPAAMLLDEPTNALDNTTEEQFLRQFHDWLDDRTLLMATHKTAPLALVNRLIVIDSGKVVADGPKQQVIDALAGGQVRKNEAGDS